MLLCWAIDHVPGGCAVHVHVRTYYYTSCNEAALAPRPTASQHWLFGFGRSSASLQSHVSVQPRGTEWTPDE